MCLVSNKIKFCTCVTGAVENLQHYWILYRFQKGKDEFILGLPLMPSSMTDPNFIPNELTIVSRLNEQDAFDSPIVFCTKDILEVVINNNATDQDKRFTFSFEFKKGKWNAIESDSFNIISHFNEAESGKIKSALKRKIK